MGSPRAQLTDLLTPAALNATFLTSAHTVASSATLTSAQQMDQAPATLTMNKAAQNKTTNKMTYLLDHLLKDYDNSLRPDIGGEGKDEISVFENLIYETQLFEDKDLDPSCLNLYFHPNVGEVKTVAKAGLSW